MQALSGWQRGPTSTKMTGGLIPGLPSCPQAAESTTVVSMKSKTAWCLGFREVTQGLSKETYGHVGQAACHPRDLVSASQGHPFGDFCEAYWLNIARPFIPVTVLTRPLGSLRPQKPQPSAMWF